MFAKLSDIFLKIMIIIITFKSFELAFMIETNLSVLHDNFLKQRLYPQLPFLLSSMNITTIFLLFSQPAFVITSSCIYKYKIKMSGRSV